jgi:hypothetical protein
MKAKATNTKADRTLDIVCFLVRVDYQIHRRSNLDAEDSPPVFTQGFPGN